MKKHSARMLAALALLLAGALQAERPISIWRLPELWPYHVQLQEQLVATIRRGDIPAMESVCRTALRVLPGDATWRYNLACSLAYREKPDAALKELERAIDLGFRNADEIARDTDLARIAHLPRFAALVQKARDLSGRPVAGRPAPAPLYAATGAAATLTETNLVFNFDTGVYDALLALSAPKTPLAAQAGAFSASKPDAPERPLVASWLADGTAAGNAGDVYLNRDRGHSALAAGDYPQLTVLRYAADARAQNADVNHPNAAFARAAVFGNVSRGFTSGPYWRSMARASFTEPFLAVRMDHLYRSNQFWVMPCVNDVGKPEIGDVFPANAPFQLVSLGASWSDQPFLRAALAASASFTPETKKAILSRRLLGPTLQWLIRRTQAGVRSEADYLSPKAHPTAFSAKSLDAAALVSMAHGLAPASVPPAVTLMPVNSRLFPIRVPVPGRDYPDTCGELLFATSSAISYVLRAPEGSRTFLFRATPFPAATEGVTYAWRVVHGDASAVQIAPPFGETDDTPESGVAQITVDRRRLAGRIDVACFAKAAGTPYGAPSIISFNALSQEVRVYRADGKIASIDYSNPDAAYCDPLLALPRRWKDTYTYAPDGKPLGFVRSVNGRPTATFTPSGDRVVETAPDGSPRRAVAVTYLPRQTGDRISPRELTYADDGAPFDIK